MNINLWRNESCRDSLTKNKMPLPMNSIEHAISIVNANTNEKEDDIREKMKRTDSLERMAIVPLQTVYFN